MRTTTIPCDAKNLLFYCLLHKLGCCFARSLQARSARSAAIMQHETTAKCFISDKARTASALSGLKTTHLIKNQRCLCRENQS